MESMVRMQTVVPRKAMIALTDCKRSARPVEIPICAKICGLKYCIAETYDNGDVSVCVICHIES